MKSELAALAFGVVVLIGPAVDALAAEAIPDTVARLEKELVKLEIELSVLKRTVQNVSGKGSTGPQGPKGDQLPASSYKRNVSRYRRSSRRLATTRRGVSAG